MTTRTPRRIAFLVFPNLTFLDFVGGYDALRRVAGMGIDKGVSHRIIGTAPRIVDDSGLHVTPDGVYEDKYWGAEARPTIAAQMAYRAYSAV